MYKKQVFFKAHDSTHFFQHFIVIWMDCWYKLVTDVAVVSMLLTLQSCLLLQPNECETRQQRSYLSSWPSMCSLPHKHFNAPSTPVRGTGNPYILKVYIQTSTKMISHQVCTYKCWLPRCEPLGFLELSRLSFFPVNVAYTVLGMSMWNDQPTYYKIKQEDRVHCQCFSMWWLALCQECCGCKCWPSEA